MKLPKGQKNNPPALRLPDFFGDHMVLQRDKPLRIFGWAVPGALVHVVLGQADTKVTCGKNGKWTAIFSSMAAGGPYTLTVTSGRKNLVIRDILIGDLWFCSGQSNMGFQLSRSLNASSAIRAARLPQIRHFQVKRIPSKRPLADVQGNWALCDPSTAGEFSAVAFYFAREIFRKTKVPVGILHSSWGGTPIEAWLPPQVYRNNVALQPLVRMQKELRRPTALLERLFKKWEKENVSLDPGNCGEKKGWARPDFDDRSWKKMKVPGFWEGQGLLIDGAVWFRRTVEIPQSWAGRELQLELGPIDDFDETYFNGMSIGTTGKSVKNAHRVPRLYRVPAEQVRAGKVCLAVRIFDQFGSGGFMGQKEMLRLSCPTVAQDKALLLAGAWKYQIEWSVDRPAPVPQPPSLPEPQGQLSQLYNGMVHALAGTPIRGFLWYQGESNAYRAAHYRKTFPLLIQSWRENWGEGALPFYFVQLANFRGCPSQPAEDSWAELREAQALALQLENTGMAVAIDVGEKADIHPRNKKEVGRRLALLALARNYGKKVMDSGPVLSGSHFEKNGVRLEFTSLGNGLRTNDGKTVRGFALAGKNRRWFWARAKIEKGAKSLFISSESVPRPVALRYAWSSNPEINLVNSEGLPLAPFRSDDWPLSTEGNLWPF